VTVYDTVNEEKSDWYTVCVPVTVEKEVSVQVCTLVAKKVLVPATSGYGAGYGAAPVSGGCGTGGCSACGSAPAAPACNSCK
jgi:hypothetical protein